MIKKKKTQTLTSLFNFSQIFYFFYSNKTQIMNIINKLYNKK